MQTFKVFPKEGLEPFGIKIERFECDGKSFTLFDSGDGAVPDEAFLSFADVAAILPENQCDIANLIPFDVFLRKRKEPLRIYAHGFKIQPPSVRFFWLYSMPDGDSQDIPNIYVATSELVCVLPSDGLHKFRKRSMSG
jgi:hypothetical protein